MYRIMPKSECTLTTTIVGEWIITPLCKGGGGIEKDKKDVDLEMRLFQCAVRTAFNRLLEGRDKGDVEKLVSSMFARLTDAKGFRFNINSRYAKDAVMQARSIQSSQREVIKQHKEEKESAIKGLRKKIEKINSEDKRESISAKIEQLSCEVADLEGHIKNYTIPKVIFGGRENFEKRRDGKLSNADWKNLRNNKLYSRGDKSKEGGNLNARIEIMDEGFDTLRTQPKGFSLSVAISIRRFVVGVLTFGFWSKNCATSYKECGKKAPAFMRGDELPHISMSRVSTRHLIQRKPPLSSVRYPSDFRLPTSDFRSLVNSG